MSDIALICLISIMAGLAMLALHWAPWRLMVGQELPKPAAYVLGTLGMMLPLTGLFAVWGLWMAVAAIWAVVGSSGLAVLGAYLVDGWLEHRQARKDAEEREREMLREAL